MNKLKGYDTVTFRDAKGNIITETNLEQRGADGGVDLIIDIAAKSKAASKRIETQILRLIDEHVAK